MVDAAWEPFMIFIKLLFIMINKEKKKRKTTTTLWSNVLFFSSSVKLLQVRKGAHDAVKSLLKKPPNGMDYHPAAGPTAKFCIQQIQQHGGKVKSGETWKPY